MRRLEIYANDKITTVEIEVLGTTAVEVLRKLEKPHWGQWFWDGLTGFKNLFSFASNLEDVIIFGNSKAIVEINNLMGVLNFEILVDEKDKSIPRGYDTFIKITISHRGKKTVVLILARSNLDKPYLHEVNAYGNIKAIKTI